MAARHLALTLLLPAALLLSGCTDDGSAAEAPPEVVARRFVELPPLGGLPPQNRFLSPEFEPVDHASAHSPSGSLLRRQVYPETPFATATARIVGEGQPVELVLSGMTGAGEHRVSLWLGTHGALPPVDATASLHGVTLSPLEGAPIPVALAPTDEVLVAEGRVWVRFEATFEALVGPVYLQVTDDGTRDLLVHAPVLELQ